MKHPILRFAIVVPLVVLCSYAVRVAVNSAKRAQQARPRMAVPIQRIAVEPPIQTGSRPVPNPVVEKVQEVDEEIILPSIDWQKLGEYQVNWSLGKVDESDPRAQAESLRYYAAMLDLIALWKDHPELKERIGRQILSQSIDGYLRAMGIELSADQMESLMRGYESQPIEKALELDWWDAGKEGYFPLDSVRNSLYQSLFLTQALRPLLSTDQLGKFVAHQPADPLWPMFRKEIRATGPGDAIQKTADHWMAKFQLGEEHRAGVRRAAESYYLAYVRLHQDYERLDADRRTEVWMATVDAQKELEKELGFGSMSTEGYQVLSFSR